LGGKKKKGKKWAGLIGPVKLTSFLVCDLQQCESSTVDGGDGAGGWVTSWRAEYSMVMGRDYGAVAPTAEEEEEEVVVVV
jgi:hypothetical protein